MKTVRGMLPYQCFQTPQAMLYLSSFGSLVLPATVIPFSLGISLRFLFQAVLYQKLFLREIPQIYVQADLVFLSFE